MAVLAVALFLASPGGRGATMAYGGEVVGAGDPTAKEKECLRTFTVKINYYDYCSRGKFGRESKVGALASQKVMPRGSVCVLNGELINARSFAKAIVPKTWGYFYENTWFSLYTTPEFRWGEVVQHDPEAQTVTLRIHRTHKDHHLAANPPVEEVVSYAGTTGVRLEEKFAQPGNAFVEGHWVQVHELRPATVDLRTAASDWDSAEWLPQAQGKRGYANDLSGPAEIVAVRTADPDKVIDNRVELEVVRDGKKVRIDCKSTTFILDGKACPPTIAARPGRRAVLCYYRNQTTPHKIFLSSIDRRTVGELGTLNLESLTGRGVKWLLDGEAVRAEIALAESKGKRARVTVFPARPRTLIAFPPYPVGGGKSG